MTDERGVGRRAVMVGLAAGLAGCGAANDGNDPGTDTTSRETTATETTGPSETTAATATTGETAAATSETTATTTATGRSDPVFPGYETTPVQARRPDGEVVGEVTAAIADTGSLRYTGLSDTPSMPEDHGMLFVYGDVAMRTFVMRRMSFPLDMIFANDDGVITVVHEAPAPGPEEDGNDITRTGRARYILEVNRGWSSERGVGEGDVLTFDVP